MTTFIEDQEEVVPIVRDWAVGIINDAVVSLTKDGRPFGSDIMTPEQQMEEYMKLRGNPEAYMKYIDSKARDLMNQLLKDGLDEESIASIHPYDIAIRFAIDWSSRMEKEMLNDKS